MHRRLPRPSRPRPRGRAATLAVALLLATLAIGASGCTAERDVARSDTATPAIPPAPDVAPWPDGPVVWPDVPVAEDVSAGPETVSDAAAGPDAGPWPTTYAHRAPDGPPPPAALRGEAWLAHLRDDLLPYWTSPAALGDPVGNFPTYRDMNGRVRPPAERRPRMLSRQTYTYAVAFLLTGDAELLGHARAGVDWLLAHAKDEERGGWYPLLEGTGEPRGTGPKTAQDTAYCMLGPGAWFFVTRDPAVEAELLATRDLLFDPAAYWDADSGRIRDALSWDLSAEVDVEGDGGWELVAQLDPVNAFLLLVQPALSDVARRTQVLGDLRALGDALVTHFFADGVFWGVHTKKGEWGSRHADFGHTLKAYWMLLQIDKRLDDTPYRALLAAHARTWSALAWDDQGGRWANRIERWPEGGAPTIRYGSDWWIYAEADQFAMTLALLAGALDPRLAASQANWIADFVDRTHDAPELVPSVGRDGSWGYPWSATDTAKCNEWKNGYHGVEHALVSYLHARWLERAPATLHFAVPAAVVDTFVATPYVFQGREVSREDRGPIEVGGETLRHVAVDFVDLY